MLDPMPKAAGYFDAEIQI